MLGLLEQMLLQDLLGAQGVAAVHQGHLGGDVGEVQGLLDRGVAAADHRHLLPAIEEAVAGGAGGHAPPAELLLGGEPQIAGAGPGGNDQGVAGVDRRVAGESEGALAQLRRC